MAVKLVNGNRATCNISIVFQGFRTLDSQRIKAVKVINLRYMSKDGMIGSWAADFTFTIFNGVGTARFVQASN